MEAMKLTIRDVKARAVVAAADVECCGKLAAIWGTPVVPLTQSGRQPVTRSRLPIAALISNGFAHAPEERQRRRGRRFCATPGTSGKIRSAHTRPIPLPPC
jgi:hypothetical protein